MWSQGYMGSQSCSDDQCTIMYNLSKRNSHRSRTLTPIGNACGWGMEQIKEVWMRIKKKKKNVSVTSGSRTMLSRHSWEHNGQSSKMRAVSTWASTGSHIHEKMSIWNLFLLGCPFHLGDVGNLIWTQETTVFQPWWHFKNGRHCSACPVLGWPSSVAWMTHHRISSTAPWHPAGMSFSFFPWYTSSPHHRASTVSPDASVNKSHVWS